MAANVNTVRSPPTPPAEMDGPTAFTFSPGNEFRLRRTAASGLHNPDDDEQRDKGSGERSALHSTLGLLHADELVRLASVHVRRTEEPYWHLCFANSKRYILFLLSTWGDVLKSIGAGDLGEPCHVRLHRFG
jgi:hypothetical protein